MQEYEIQTRSRARVALLAEGVDRNELEGFDDKEGTLSPSSRRAWIEIAERVNLDDLDLVALLAEGVDRNYEALQIGNRADQSPSSRRAWIEIFPCLSLSF